MAAPFSSLLLDISSWDLTISAAGDIARADPAYAVAQDMSTQCRQWRGEYIYDQSAGVPLSSILGQSPSLGVMKADFVTAAAQVPATTNVKCFIQSVADRLVSGQVQATVVVSGTATVVASPIGGAHAP